MGGGVEGGVEGFFFDNCESPAEDLALFLPEIRRWLRLEVKSPAILQWNLHVYCRPQNIPLEDVCDVMYNEWCPCTPGVGDDGLTIVGNIRWAIRYMQGHLPAGKPVHSETPRYKDSGFSPRTQRLYSFEASAFGASVDRFMDGYVHAGLLSGAPEVLASWHAVGEGRRFLTAQSDLCLDTESVAGVGILVYGPNWEEKVLDALTRTNLLYDILEIRALDRVDLSRYRLVVAAGAPAPDRQMLRYLPTYRGRGGRVAACCDDEAFAGLADITWPTRLWESAQLDAQGAGELAREITKAAGPPVLEVGGVNVIANLRRKVDRSSWILHLLNYGTEPVRDVAVRAVFPDPVKAKVNLQVFSADGGQATVYDVTTEKNVLGFCLRLLDQYAVVSIPSV